MRGKKWMKRLVAGLLICALCVGNGTFAADDTTMPAPHYEITGRTYTDPVTGTIWVGGGASEIKISAPEGYYISFSEDGLFSSSVHIMSGAAIPENVYLKDTASGDVSPVPVTGIQRDTTPPAGKLHVDRGEQSWSTLHVVTLDRFWKEQQVTASVMAEDEGCGVGGIEYYVSDTDLSQSPREIEQTASGKWKSYAEPFGLKEKSTNIIYVKLTDRVGNVAYINSAGQILYEDSLITTETAVYHKGTEKDVAIDVELKGNTMKSLSINGEGLTPDADYTVSEGKLLLKGSRLETLPLGEYTLMMEFSPLGIAFEDAAVGDAPTDAGLILSVQVDTADWGERIFINDIPHYVDKEGRTSVTVEEKDTVFLQESCEGFTGWFALDNRKGVFEKGSRFWVRILSEDEDYTSWKQAYELLDENIKGEMEHLMLYEIGVTNPDGEAYTQFVENVPLSVQIPQGWDEEETQFIYVNTQNDESFRETIEPKDYPGGTGDFVSADVNHFSVYGLFDQLSQAEKEALAQKENDNTGSEGSGDVNPGDGNDDANDDAKKKEEGNGKTPKTPASPKKTVETEKGESGMPETGDGNSLFGWITAALAAVWVRTLWKKKWIW